MLKLVNFERDRMRHVNNYFRVMKSAVQEDGKVISVLADVFVFDDASDAEVARMLNAARACAMGYGTPVVVYRQLDKPFQDIPYVGESLGAEPLENNWS